MTELERANLRMACLIEAIKLKQHTITASDYYGKTVAAVAEELAAFVLGE